MVLHGRFSRLRPLRGPGVQHRKTPHLGQIVMYGIKIRSSSS